MVQVIGMDIFEDVALPQHVPLRASTCPVIRKKPASNGVRRTIAKKTACAAMPLLSALHEPDTADASVTATNVTPPSLGSIISYGSMCSGLGVEHWAAKRAHPGRVARHVFTCESCPIANKWLAANVPSLERYTDVGSDDFRHGAPSCTIATAGFPCQPFSNQGKGEGVFDPAGRGLIIAHILNYLRSRQPRIAILENVRGLVSCHQKTFLWILSELRAIVDNVTGKQCYSVHWRILDSRKVGKVAQHRERVYLVLIKRCGRSHVPFTWPSETSPVPLELCYDDGWQSNCISSYDQYPMDSLSGKTAHKNVKKALVALAERAKQDSRRPESYACIVDKAASSTSGSFGYAPCLTAARGSCFAFMNLQTGTNLTISEMFRLQGFDDTEMASMKLDCVSDRQISTMLGDSFTKTVMQRLINLAIRAAESTV